MSSGSSSPFWRFNSGSWHEAARSEGSELHFLHEDDDSAIIAWESPVGEKNFYRPSPEGVTRRVSLVACGEAARTADLISGALQAGTIPPLTWGMMAEPIAEHLTDRAREFFGPYWGNQWDFYWATEPLPQQTGHENVQLLDLATWRDEVVRVIEESNPSTSALADVDGHQWYGFITDEGDLAAAMAVQRRTAGDGSPTTHFAGLGTDPAFRGQGIGGATMGTAINKELEQVDSVAFGMWSENDPARNLYAKLGITLDIRLISASHVAFRPH